MLVVDTRIEAGGPLVAPEWGGAVLHHVGEGAVEELKEFIPFVGEVQACLHAPEANSIVDDILEDN